MNETKMEKLVRAQFWAMEAMRQYDAGSRQRDVLSRACDLIDEAVWNEEEAARIRALKAAQLA